MSDILAQIDAAIGCHQCEGPLGDSPSGDFCSEPCQARWTAERVGEEPRNFLHLTPGGQSDIEAVLISTDGGLTWTEVDHSHSHLDDTWRDDSWIRVIVP